MAERAITRRGGIGAILGTGDRDFLVRNSGEQVSPNIREEFLVFFPCIFLFSKDAFIYKNREQIVTFTFT